MTTAFNTSVICPILIGRTAELAAFHLLIDQVKSGRGQVALLWGEAGVGKSRLVAETKTYAASQGFLLLQGNCFQADRAFPYAPFLDLLRSCFSSSSPLTRHNDLTSFAQEFSRFLPDVAPLIPEHPPLVVPSSLDPEQEQRRLFALLLHFFTRAAIRQPLLFIVEDLHWSDETSLELLLYLARGCRHLPILFVLTYRSDEVSPELRHYLAEFDREHLAQDFSLQRLARADVDAMLQAIFAMHQAVHTGLLESIYQLTEGNPFFIEEVLKSLIATGEITSREGVWERTMLFGTHTRHSSIPRSVQDAVYQRTKQLSAPARQVLTLAAVAGRRFDFTILQQVMHADASHMLALMKELVVAQFVVEEAADQFAFRHALTRQAVYSELLAGERRAWHRTIAETIEQRSSLSSVLDAQLVDLAYHFYEAGVWSKAAEYGQRAGERALILYAPRAAIEHLTRALVALKHLDGTPPATVLRARGQAYETIGEFEQARADYERALAIAQQTQDSIMEWQSLLDIGFLWAGRAYAQTGDYYQQALELARTMDDPAALAHSLNRLGNWYLNVEQPHEALRCHQEALATFQGLHDRSGFAKTLDLLGVASYLSGDLMQSAAYYEQAIALLRELDERARLPNSLATLMLCGGNYQTETLVPAAAGFAESLKLGELALKIAGEIGQRSDEAYALIHMGMCLGPRGEYARALEVAQRGLAIAEDIEHRQWMTAGHRALGALYLDLLAVSEAQQHLEQALALAQEIGSRFWTRVVSEFLALVSLAQHDVTRAEALLNAALGPDDPAQTIGQRLVWAARADLALARGDPGLALDITDRLIASAANLSGERVIPRLWKLRGEALVALHREAEAETVLRAAQAAAHAQGLRPWLWRIYLDLGKLHVAQRRSEEAEYAFLTTQEIVEELAANVPDGALRENFLSRATAPLPRSRPLSPRRVTKEAFGGLTEREREVAALIAQGKASREIAEILVVNSRTIEKHIENMLSKLGFTSRAQIAVWASEKGLGPKEQSQL